METDLALILSGTLYCEVQFVDISSCVTRTNKEQQFLDKLFISSVNVNLFVTLYRLKCIQNIINMYKLTLR